MVGKEPEEEACLTMANKLSAKKKGRSKKKEIRKLPAPNAPMDGKEKTSEKKKIVERGGEAEKRGALA